MEFTLLLLPLLVPLAHAHGDGAQEESGNEEKTGTGYIYPYNSGYENEYSDGEQVGQVEEHEHVRTITVTEEVPVLYPVFKKVHYPVKEYVEKAAAYPVQEHVPVQVRVPVKVPYPLHIPKVTVDKTVPYPVHVRVPVFVPVKVPVPKPYPVTVEKKVFIPYLVQKPVPYRVHFLEKVPVPVQLKEPYPVTVEKKVPIFVKVPVGKPYPVRAAVPIKEEEQEDGFDGERLPEGPGGRGQGFGGY